jgi:hypothetical protein
MTQTEPLRADATDEQIGERFIALLQDFYRRVPEAQANGALNVTIQVVREFATALRAKFDAQHDDIWMAGELSGAELRKRSAPLAQQGAGSTGGAPTEPEDARRLDPDGAQEVAELREANRTLVHQLERRADGMDDLTQSLRAENERLRSAVVESASPPSESADTERLDLLEQWGIEDALLHEQSDLVRVEKYFDDETERGVTFRVLGDKGVIGRLVGERDTLREAIDAARSTPPPADENNP